MINIIHEAVRPALHALGCRGAHIYLVGGAVRDWYLGIAPKDQDFVITKYPLDRVIDVLNGYGRCDIAGKSFGVIKFRPAGQDEVFDIALPRKEKSIGDKRSDFLIDADPNIPLEIDLTRRDFSCNSIAIDIFDGTIIDPLNGVHDISSKIIRPSFDKAFEEDPTRMMRAIQFAARLGFKFAPETSDSMRKNAYRIKNEAPDRVATEFCKLLKAKKPSIGFAMMRSHGLMDHVIPELAQLSRIPQPKQYHKYDVMSHCLVACDQTPANNIYRRLTALLHDIGKFSTLTYKEDGTPQFLGHDHVGAEMARNFLSRWQFTAAKDFYIPVDRIVNAIEHHMFECDMESSDKTVRRFVAKVGPSYIIDLLRLRISDRAAKGYPSDPKEWVRFANRIRVLQHGSSAFTVKDLALNGNDVMRILNIPPGKQIGVALNRLMEVVLDNPEMNNEESLTTILRST